jgi:hypothetical protein
MASLSSKIKAHLGREVDFRTEVVLVDNSDGQGPRISEWNAPEPQPSEAELSAAEPVANAAEASEAAIHSRRVSYGNISDQLDMMYWDQVNGTNIWFDHIAKVKADNPK